MPSTVFANFMGFFHSGSGGTGIAPLDVCLSPPPPPAGPVPVPYVNNLSASDLAMGSQTVKIQGNPTALEDSSFVAVSTGDEAGTLGGNVITHMIKGKGYFMLWSFNVKVEGKGVCRMGDMMGQNEASQPPGCVDAAAIVNFLALPWVNTTKPCPPKPKYPGTKTTESQRKNVRGGPCWECVKEGKPGLRSGRRKWKNFTPDHQPPSKAAWFMGGCHNPKKFKKWRTSKDAAKKPHCSAHTKAQAQTMKDATVADIRGWM
jgi:uncharacterized Zn-binding protein involved in type VI secretion